MIKKNIFKKVLIPIFLLFSIYAHNISSMQQDKQETIFAAHLANKSILIMSADTGNVLHTIEKGLYTQWSPDESYFAVQKNNTIEIWKTTHWKLSKILKPTGKIQSTLFSPDAKYLAVQVGNKDIEIWNTENWKNLTTLKHNNKIQSRQFSPDGRFFAVQAGDTVDIWDTEHWEKVHTLTYTGEIQAIAFSPNANVRYLAVQIGNTIEIWDTANWEKEPILLYKEKALRPFDSTQDQDDRQEEEIQSIVFSPNGRSFAVQWKDEVHIWNTANWNQEPTVLTREFRTGIIIFAPGDIHKRRKGKIQFSPDSKYLAVQIGEEDNIDIWDMTDLKKEPKTLLYTCGKLGKIAFTPGGNYFTVRIVHTVSNPQSDIWNTRNWKLIKSLRYPNTIWLGKFSPDDRYFITYIWNIQEMQILDTRNWHVKHAKKLDKQIWSIAFQPSKAKWKQQQERFRKAKEAQEDLQERREFVHKMVRTEKTPGKKPTLFVPKSLYFAEKDTEIAQETKKIRALTRKIKAKQQELSNKKDEIQNIKDAWYFFSKSRERDLHKATQKKEKIEKQLKKLQALKQELEEKSSKKDTALGITLLPPLKTFE